MFQNSQRVSSILSRCLTVICLLCVFFQFESCDTASEDKESPNSEMNNRAGVASSIPFTKANPHYSVLIEKAGATIKIASSNGRNAKLRETTVTQNLTQRFGTPSWDEGQFVTYQNGIPSIVVPLVKEGKATASLIAIPVGDRSFKAMVMMIEGHSNPKSGEFNGQVKYFDIYGAAIAEYQVKDSRFVLAAAAKVTAPARKSAISEETPKITCNWTCFTSCIEAEIASNATLAFLCGLACGALETPPTLVACAVCVSAVSTSCLNSCNCLW